MTIKIIIMDLKKKDNLLTEDIVGA